MGAKLTKKQTLIFDFIKKFIAENEVSPSYRDIATGVGLSSVASVAEHIDNLVMLGVIKKNNGTARSLEIVDDSFPETTQLINSRIKYVSDEEKEILKKAANILGISLEAEANDEEKM